MPFLSNPPSPCHKVNSRLCMNDVHCYSMIISPFLIYYIKGCVVCITKDTIFFVVNLAEVYNPTWLKCLHQSIIEESWKKAMKL